MKLLLKFTLTSYKFRNNNMIIFYNIDNKNWKRNKENTLINIYRLFMYIFRKVINEVFNFTYFLESYYNKILLYKLLYSYSYILKIFLYYSNK